MSAHHASAAHAVEAMIRGHIQDLRPIVEKAIREYEIGFRGESKEQVGERLSMTLAEYIAGRLATEILPFKGWICPACAAFNGEARARLSACRHCGLARR